MLFINYLQRLGRRRGAARPRTMYAGCPALRAEGGGDFVAASRPAM